MREGRRPRRAPLGWFVVAAVSALVALARAEAMTDMDGPTFAAHAIDAGAVRIAETEGRRHFLVDDQRFETAAALLDHLRRHATARYRRGLWLVASSKSAGGDDVVPALSAFARERDVDFFLSVPAGKAPADRVLWVVRSTQSPYDRK